MQDYFGNEIKIGDYVCYPKIEGTCRVEYTIAKVTIIRETTFSALYKTWRGKLEGLVFRRPDRAIVISEELAFEKEPLFKDVIE